MMINKKRIYTVLTMMTLMLVFIGCTTDTDPSDENYEDGIFGGVREGDVLDILDEPGIVIEGGGPQIIEIDGDEDDSFIIEVEDEDTNGELSSQAEH